MAADIVTFEIAAALLKVTSTPMTDLRQYINSILVYNDRQIRPISNKYVVGFKTKVSIHGPFIPRRLPNGGVNHHAKI